MVREFDTSLIKLEKLRISYKFSPGLIVKYVLSLGV